jgi:hypothetical protein
MLSSLSWVSNKIKTCNVNSVVLEGRNVQICDQFQYMNMNICGIAIGFTIAASISMMWVVKT